jgi:nitrogen fixation/metabolism regulation signal transduction histidine kinase
MVVTMLSLIAIWVAVITLLIYQSQRALHDLERFFQAIENNDSMLTFTKTKVDPAFRKLYNEFERVIGTLQKTKLDKERELSFLRIAAEHAGVGLLAFSRSGEIKLINRAFIALFKSVNAKNIDQFNHIDSEFVSFLDRSKPGNSVLKLLVDNRLKLIAARVVLFRFEDEEYKLIAFQDIKNEIDQTELDAWQKLIRILRHEIHNSLSPITFISSGLLNQLEAENNNQRVTTKTIENTIEGLKVIRRRSISLNEFVDGYKKLTSIPIPQFRAVPVRNILQRAERLLKSECDAKGIQLRVNPPNDGISLYIDEGLIEQVIINICHNAIEALKGTDNPTITLECNSAENSNAISISNNGPIIPNKLMESIFTPFFTTRKEGSGIGLSLSRQIMRLHNGTLQVNNGRSKGVTFTLFF